MWFRTVFAHKKEYPSKISEEREDSAHVDVESREDQTSTDSLTKETQSIVEKVNSLSEGSGKTVLSNLISLNFWNGKRDKSPNISTSLYNSHNGLRGRKIDEVSKNILNNMADVIIKQDYLILLAQCFACFGSPEHRLEDNMMIASAALDIQSSFAFLPGLILASFEKEDMRTSDTYLVVVNESRYMDRLEKCLIVSQQVGQGTLPVKEGYQILSTLYKNQKYYPEWSEIVSYGLYSFFSCSLSYGGGIQDWIVSGFLGLIVGVLRRFSKNIYTYDSILEISAGFLVSIISTSLHAHVCYVAVMLSGVTKLVPGYAIAVSILDLAAQNIVSGTLRLLYNISLSFILAFGLSFGSSVYQNIGVIPIEHPQCHKMNPLWILITFPMASICSAVMNHASPRQLPAIIGLSSIGYISYYFLSRLLNPGVATAIAAFNLALCGNIFTLVTGKIGLPGILNGVALLVPGGLGVRGIFEIIVESSHGLELALQMFRICICLAFGLFLGSLVLSPSTRKHPYPTI
ncbi:pheromone-regulated protein prm10 [Basidiobolus ranarum]|uniref:Pheromone-regulated protein prm10 n=1 Tax=Basidiobolus ranarum TaxID=34480 RepID=A0ABR2WMV0_9FUNG